MKLIGEVTVKVVRDEGAVLRLTQKVATFDLENDETGVILTGFPVPLVLIFRKEGEPDHTVGLVPLLHEVARQIDWRPK